MNTTPCTCLLIDDNYIDSFISRKMLENSHYSENVVIKLNPIEALDNLREGTLKPDVIFLDLRMPDMDGFEFLENYDKIPIDKEHTKIFIMSNSIDPKDKRKAEENKNVTEFISKPLTPDVIKSLAA